MPSSATVTRDVGPAARDRHPLAAGAAVAVAVGERLLKDPVERDLRRQRTVAEVGRRAQLDRLIGERLMLHRQSLDDLAERPALEAGRPKGTDEVADLAQRALEHAHGLPGAFLGHARQ